VYSFFTVYIFPSSVNYSLSHYDLRQNIFHLFIKTAACVCLLLHPANTIITNASTIISHHQFNIALDRVELQPGERLNAGLLLYIH
jgi:hypothetical protein